MTVAQLKETYGAFDWQEDPHRKGLVLVEARWTRGSIIPLPNTWGIVNCEGKIANIECHRLVAAKIAAAFNDLAGQGLIGLVKTFDGCFVPRHICWNPKRRLSSHTWGVALDVNARWCPYGSEASQPAKLLSAFRAHGFVWGGEFSTPDPMHFEIGI
jgi:hypothetical protein